MTSDLVEAFRPFSELNITSALTEVDFSEMKQALDFLPERMK